MTTTEIVEILRTHQQEIKERFGIRHLALFGSYARGEATEESDVDLVIREAIRKNGFLRAKAMRYLSELTKKRVDIGYFDAIRPFYRETIERDLIDVF